MNSIVYYKNISCSCLTTRINYGKYGVNSLFTDLCHVIFFISTSKPPPYRDQIARVACWLKTTQILKPALKRAFL